MLLAAAMTLTFMPLSVFADSSGVDGLGARKIIPYNFPDPVFMEYVKQFDKNKNGSLEAEEREAVKTIDVRETPDAQELTSLRGVEFFPCLEKLFCNANKLTELDVSRNTALTGLYCYDAQLTELDVSRNPALEFLYCPSNQLTKLDVSKNAALKQVSCSENQLTQLDLSKNTNLNLLECNRNQLTSLNLGVTKVLKSTLYLQENQYPITIDKTARTFDLRTLPGKFDVSKAADWTGGTVSGSTLMVDEGADKVTYTYDCGRELSAKFTLTVTETGGSTGGSTGGGSTGGGSTGGGSTGGGSTGGGSTGGGSTGGGSTGGGSTGGSTGGEGGGGGGAVVLLAGGAALLGGVGIGVYNYVTNAQLKALLPAGTPVPENRAQTALLLWNTAGRPEPAAAPAFVDIADPDTAKAAQWCVEAGLLEAKSGISFDPYRSISRAKVLKAYKQLR